MKHISDAVILIVDDKEENLAALVATLGDDYDVSVATDGASALEVVKVISPDLILLDVVMPDMDGFEVCSSLKSKSVTSAIPVLFLTSLTDSAAKTRGFAAGAVDYITKPFDISEVRARVHTHLSIYFMRLELARQKETAMENARMKAEFLATMSHEIRTPLNGILGMAQLLMDTSLTPQQLRFAQIIADSGNSLLTIVNDILDNSKLEAGKVELESIIFEPRKLLDSVQMLMAERVVEKGLRLYIEVADSVPQKLSGDPTRIRQILLNFLGNAIKFTSRGFIHISMVSDMEGKLYFSVADTGIGIRKEDRKKLFAEFSQVDSSISRKYGGTGLGLVISRRLVALMQGRIGVRSESGRGSEFWFEIPVMAVNSQAATDLEKDKENTSLPKMKILVADDNVINQEVLRGILDDSYHEISLANNGQEAVRACTDHLFDVVLMDMHMPDMDGVKAVEQIRLLPGVLGQVPVIGVTASAISADKNRCLEAGMNGFITKPIVQNVLFREIAAVVKPEAKIEINPVAVKAELQYFDREQLGYIESSLGQSGVLKIFRQFIRNLEAFETGVKKAYFEHNAQDLFSHVHKLKGAALNLALCALAEIMEELEAASKSEDWEDIRVLVLELGVILEKTLRELGKLYPEISDETKNEIAVIFLQEYSIYRFEEALLRMQISLVENSLEKYANVANSLFYVPALSLWARELRRIDTLVNSNKFAEAESVILEIRARLQHYKPEDSTAGLQEILLRLNKMLQLSKPREISSMVAALKRLDLSESLAEKRQAIISRIESYNYKQAALLLEECLQTL